MKDDGSEARRNFTGLKWFPVREEWRIRARFTAAPRNMLFDAQAGDKQEMMSPGVVEWEKDGRTFRLTPVLEDDQLFFVFRDKTAGKSTYAAARFLYADLPKDGFVIAISIKLITLPVCSRPMRPARCRRRRTACRSRWKRARKTIIDAVFLAGFVSYFFSFRVMLCARGRDAAAAPVPE